MIRKIIKKFFRAIGASKMRVKYYRKPLDFNKLAKQYSLNAKQSLDIGSGPSPRNPFNASLVYGIDVRSWDINENVKRCILGSEPIPFEDGSFSAITAYDVLEHIPRIAIQNNEMTFPFVLAMNEVWRVLEVGGLFYSQTPCYPMQEAFQDPTHVNIMTEDTLKLYFAENAWARIYGFVGCFSTVTEGWLGSHYFCVLRKTSDVALFQINEPQAR